MTPPPKRFASYDELRQAYLTTAYADRFGEVNLDVDALARLTGEDRAEAVALLRKEVGGPMPDPEAVDALDQLAGRGKAAGAASDEDLKALLSVLNARGSDRAKLGAIRALTNRPGPEVDAALVASLADQGEFVAQTAYEALCTRFQVDGSVYTRIGRLSALLNRGLAVQRRPALAEVQAFFRTPASGAAKLAESAPHERSAAFLAFQRSVFGDLKTGSKPVGPLDGEAFAALADEERAWGEQWVVGLLVDGDRRGFDFLATIDAAWARPALEELSKRKSSAGRKSAALLRAQDGPADGRTEPS